MRAPALRVVCFVSLCLLFLTFSPPVFAQTIQVTSANPNNAPQGTVSLNVTVGGNGFKKGAKAAWFVTGTTNPGGVTVNSTGFNSSSQLTANITVSSTATTGSFDVVVTNTDGRSGKGTQLFAVSSGTGNGGPSEVCGYNVTSTLANGDANNNPFQLLSDLKGSYLTGTISKTDSSLSVIQESSCDWLLDLSASTSRTVQLSLAYPDSTISSNPPPPFTGTQTVTAPRIISICGKNPLNNGVTFGTMTSITSSTNPGLQCGFAIFFNYGGQGYLIAHDPLQYSGTNWVQVNCNGLSGSGSTVQCNSWTVFPVSPGPTNNVGQNSAIGELFLFGKNGRETPIGLYETAFSITITNP